MIRRMEVVMEPGCGNSPKALLLAKAEVAIAGRDLPTLLEMVTDDFYWEINANDSGQGAEALIRQMSVLYCPEPAEKLELMHVITHGRAGAVSGSRTEQGGSQFSFASIYVFTGAAGVRIAGVQFFIISKNLGGSDGPQKEV